MRSALSTLSRLISADVRLVASEVAFARRRSPLKVELDGVVLTVGPWALTSIRDAIKRGEFEDEERDVVLATMRASDVVLELGAGSGYLTTIAAGIAAEVRAFEANPKMASIARSTVADNGRRATITNGVVSRDGRGGTAPFYASPHFAGSSLLPVDDAQVIDVPVFDFAEAIAGSTYLIVDIEGAEIDLLAGELPGVERICVECHPSVTGVPRIVEMIESLRGQGFALDPEISRGQVLYLAR